MKQLRQPRSFADVARQVGMNIDLDATVPCPGYFAADCTRLATSVGMKSCCNRPLLACDACRPVLEHTLTVWWLEQYGTKAPCRCGGTTDRLEWRPL